MRKTPIVRDPKIYGWAVERGYAPKKKPPSQKKFIDKIAKAPKKIPPRPLFGLSLLDFQKKFTDKITKARMAILSEWK